MTITNGYITLKELKGHLASSGLPTEFTPEEEKQMEIAIEACCRFVDDHHDTNFYGETGTKYYTSSQPDLLWIDDLVSLTTLKTDEDGDGVYENNWTSSDYWLEPRNAQVFTEPRPYRQIRINPNGDYSFPTAIRYGVEIAGDWGYSSSAPKVIKEAVLLMSNRIYRRKDAIFGVSGTAGLGVTVVKAKIQEDSDIIKLLQGVDLRAFYAI